MTVLHLTQDSLIEALRALRKTHPGLPDIRWEISSFPSVGLRGSVFSHHADSEVLAAYAAAIGGRVARGFEFNYPSAEGQRVMQHLELHTVWADVPFTITGAVPVAAEAGVTA